jgi:hypothetical protein
MRSSYKVTHRILSTVLVLMLALSSSQPTAAQSKEEPELTSNESRQTINGEPLQITVLEGLATGVNREGARQFFANFDSGTFLAVDGQVYGPQPGANAGFEPVPFTPITQSGPTGRGSQEDPFRIETVVLAGKTGIELIHVTSYVNGMQSYHVTTTVTNGGGARRDVKIFHAADLFINVPGNHSDYGVGFFDQATGAVGGLSEDGKFGQLLIPSSTSPATAHYEGSWEGVIPFWRLIGDKRGAVGPGFDNSINTSLHDVAAGLEWDRSIGAGSSSSVSLSMSFGPLVSPVVNDSPEPALVSVVVRPTPNLTVARDTIVAFTITATNRGKGWANDAELTLPFDPAVMSVIDASFSTPRGWVSRLEASSLTIRTGSLSSGESISATLRMRTGQNLADGTNLRIGISLVWRDRAEGGNSRSNHIVLTVASENTSQSLYALTAMRDTSNHVTAFSSTIFVPNEPVGIWYDTPDGRSVAVATIRADTEGVSKAAAPENLPPGNYTMVMYGLWSEFTGVTGFTVP